MELLYDFMLENSSGHEFIYNNTSIYDLYS